MSSSTAFGSGVFGSGPLGSAPFFDVKAIIDAVLYTTGHSSPASETTKRRAILQYINNSYQEIVFSHNWRWMYASYDISMFAPYETGSVNVTNNSATITGVGTVFSSNYLRAQFSLKSKNIVYNVLSISSPTSLTLQTKYAEDDETEVSFQLALASYKLPTEADQIKIMAIDNINLRLIPLGEEDFAIMKSKDPSRLGTPRYYSLKKRETDDDAQYVEVYPAPDKDYNVHLTYSVRIFRLDDSASCYPIIPDRYRVVLYYGALMQFYRYTKDLDNAALAQRDFERSLVRLQNDTQTTDNRLRIVPAREYRGRLNRRYFRGYLDRYDFGRFD